jgi:magnesium-transporting ATPase (P-type)
MFFKRRISSDSHEPSGNQILSQPAHALPTQDVVRELASDGRLGLQHTEATARLLKYGPNLFGEEKAIQPIRILFAQLFNVMTLVSCCKASRNLESQLTLK